jgi:hypothetical protein
LSDFGWIELPSRKKGMKTQYDRLSFEDKAAIGDRMIKPIMEIYAKMSVNVILLWTLKNENNIKRY